jgi:polar amino acid transport system permease protein
MTPLEIADTLWVWTPFLAGGFAMNVLISLVAMAMGTVLGWGLALARLSERKSRAHAGAILTEGARNIPTFVFLFYLAFLIPGEIDVGGTLLTIPGWFKAASALSIAVVGFVSDNLSIAIRDWRRGDHGAAMLFLPSWTAYLLIIVMASSTASVVGVGEIVSRCNTIIGAVGRNELMLWVYLYAMAWFFIFCYPLTLLMRNVRRRMEAKIAAGHAADEVINAT